MEEYNSNEGPHQPKSLSFVQCFKALWSCYSPVYQMQQYYRVGVFRNCSDKWSALFDCLTKKNKSSVEVQEILQQREKGKRHFWTYRTPEEAAVKWREWYEKPYKKPELFLNKKKKKKMNQK